MSNKLSVRYEGSLHAVGRMTPPDCSVAMDAPAALGGSGESFCPVDLFGVAYGGCIAMTMDMAARRNGFDIAGAEVNVSVVSSRPGVPHVDGMEARVTLRQPLTEQQLDVLRKGAANCPVHQSLRPEVRTTLTFQVA